jgi:putative ATP-dependent endonuclease of OLD family
VAAGTRPNNRSQFAGKGWFAIMLSKTIHPSTKIPEYILKALLFANAAPNRGAWRRIFHHRLACLGPTAPVGDVASLRVTVEAYGAGTLELADVKANFQKYFATDEIIRILDLVL